MRIARSRSWNRVKRSAWLAAAGAACTLTLAACDTVKPPGGALQDPLPAQQYPQVVAGSLQRWIGFDRPNEQRDPVLSVTVPARALTDGQQLNVQYRFFWFDASGRPADAEPTWRYMRMPSRTQVFFEGNALDNDAVNWRLEIRPNPRT
ncbi:MAG: DUF1425 domain-containing protein [Planctomycetota bacterium]|nr:DUF1425 domain-containing protein [Planctomycetota bacterium]